jgi:subtilisin family serine protease
LRVRSVFLIEFRAILWHHATRKYNQQLLMKKLFALAAGLLWCSALAQSVNIGINVSLKSKATPSLLSDLAKVGKVRDVISSINCVTMQVRADKLAVVRAKPYVASANPDAVRDGAPVDGVAVEDFADGRSTWDLDIMDVTDSYTGDRVVAQDGEGVYVAVLDTGLADSWRYYFPQERVAAEYAACFGGGGGEMGTVSTQPNKWEHDQSTHGTHVVSTIIGYNLLGIGINGVAPMANVIPVKVLNQNGRGWSSVIARGIVYVAELKAGPLKDAPVIINMSLGGSALDAVEKAAIDYAISKGVIIVASAGNNGEAGMGYPGAYAPVISVAAAGWINEWMAPSWWLRLDVSEPTISDDVYISDFSSRALDGQDLDVAAPGSNVVGPYQVSSGQISYYYLGGTSMASPHVAGLVALMAQKNAGLTAAQAEQILESTATPIAPGSRMVMPGPGMAPASVEFGPDATGAGLVNAPAALMAVP